MFHFRHVWFALARSSRSRAQLPQRREHPAVAASPAEAGAGRRQRLAP
jgi:hypothetical protein